MTQRDSVAGLTLVEMLVALVLFAMVGIASFTTLDTIIRVRDRTEGRLENLAQIDRALQLFSRDLTQSVPGGIKGDGTTLTVYRGAKPALIWQIQDGSLTRQAQTSAAEAALKQSLLAVADAKFRFVDSQGNWFQIWPNDQEAPALRGVEMALDLGPTQGVLLRLAQVPDATPDRRDTNPLSAFSGSADASLPADAAPEPAVDSN